MVVSRKLRVQMYVYTGARACTGTHASTYTGVDTYNTWFTFSLSFVIWEG